MTDREFFIYTLTDELPRFERVLNALPAEQLTWRPHPDSRSAMELATTVAVDAMSFAPFLETGVIDYWQVMAHAPQGFEQGLAGFSQNMNKAKQLVEQMSEAEWEDVAKMVSGDKVDWETTKGKMAWGLLLDLIHHRGQLSVYIRPMGGKVPSIYGPSADSK